MRAGTFFCAGRMGCLPTSWRWWWNPTDPPRQLYLYRLLDLTPPSFCHVPLLLAPDGRRLSKRDADAGLEVLQGRMSAQAVLGKLAYLAGFHPSAEPASAWELLEEFDWDKVPRSDIRLPEHFFEI